MDKVTTYSQYMKDILAEYLRIYPSTEQKQSLVIADDTQKVYMLMRIGWNQKSRIHNCMFHADIINGKIWIQEDWTDYSIAQELTDRNVPKSDIVLAFHPKDVREETEFAVN